MGIKPEPRTLPTPVRLLARWDRFRAPWMICVPDAVALPAKLSGRVFCLQPLENTIELLSYGADCPPRPPMMPAETFSGEPTPRLRLIQQSSSHAPRYQKHSLSRLFERQTFFCAKHKRSPGRTTAGAIVPLHLIHGRTPKPVSYSSVDGKHNKSCLLYTSPSPRDKRQSRMPSSA